MATSLPSTATIPNTAATSMTSLNTLSLAHPTTSDITAGASPTRSKTSSEPILMSCECCWEKFKTLRKHYPSCSALNGDWKFWASPYYRMPVFYDRKVFVNHIRSLKADTTLIESTLPNYVTPRMWTTQFPEQAMKRQLRNILDGYFKNSDFAAKWKALNNDDMSPNLDNITDMRDVLKRCSEILCRPQTGDVEESPIDQLKALFLIDTEDVTEITAQDVPLSKKRKCSVPYNALDGITSTDQPKVKVADSGFTGAQFTRHQQDQIGEQDQTHYVSMGGIVQGGSQWSAPGSSDAEPTGDTSDAPSALGQQTQSTNWVPIETPNGLTEVQFGASTDFTDGTGFPLQTLQQGQDAHAFPNANPNADVDIHALHACFNERYYSECLPRNPLSLPQAPNARQNTNSNASNDFGTSNSWNTDFSPAMQYQQTFLQMPNAQVYPNVSAGNSIDNFNDWDSPDMQYQQTFLQTPNAQVHPNVSAGNSINNFNNRDPPHVQYQQIFPQMSNAYVHPDASAGNGLYPLFNWNPNSMPQYLHMLQQQRQIVNTNTNNDLGTFDATNQGSFPVHANTTATGYRYPQHRNPAPYDYRAS